MNYVAKVELFERRWQGWILSRLGAFPIRRGESDEDSMETARLVVERGGAVCIFPEGTRIRSGSLAEPKRGVGRLALQTGAPVIPTAVLGTEHVRRGWRIRPRKVKVRLGRAMTFPRADRALAGAGRDGHRADLAQRRAAVGGPRRPAADAPRRGDRRRQLGHRGRRAARPRRPRGPARHPHRRAGGRARRGAREPAATCQGVALPDSIDVRPASEIELAGLDLVCLAIPSGSLPQAVGAIADRVGDRSAVLLLTKGLIAPLGQLPAEYVGERVRARAIACLGGPAHAREAVSGSAALVLGSADADLRAQLGEVFDRAGLVCERSGDVTGVEMAGAAKNAAALAAAAAEPHGLNAAGIAAAEIWRECIELRDRARRRARDLLRPRRGRRPDRDDDGARPAATAAPASCSAAARRRRRSRRMIGQASEGLDAVPLLAEAVAAAGGRGRGADRARGADPRRDRRRGLGRRACAGSSGRGAPRASDCREGVG